MKNKNIDHLADEFSKVDALLSLLQEALHAPHSLDDDDTRHRHYQLLEIARDHLGTLLRLALKNS